MSELPELEVKCEDCDGKGGYSDIEADGGFAECHECGGSGFVPTEFGRRILTLMKHHFKIEVQTRVLLAGQDT